MKTVLLLEDEPLIAIDVEQTLRDAGFDVSVAATCADAAEWLEVCRPEVVIIDIVLRDGPCHQVAKQLVQDNIPFVVHSGDILDAHAGTPFEYGVWLSKPSMPGDLIAAIRQATSARQQP